MAAADDAHPLTQPERPLAMASSPHPSQTTSLRAGENGGIKGGVESCETSDWPENFCLSLRELAPAPKNCTSACVSTRGPKPAGSLPDPLDSSDRAHSSVGEWATLETGVLQMKKSVLATLLATALSVGAAYAAAVPPASPQGDAEAKNPSAAGGGGVTVGPGAAAAQATFTLQAADAAKLKDWIMQQKTASVAAPAGFNVAVGQTLPASIMLNAIPANAGVSSVGSNQYAVIDNKIVLVNPTDRKIVFVVL